MEASAMSKPRFCHATSATPIIALVALMLGSLPQLNAAEKIIERSGSGTSLIAFEPDGTLKYLPNKHGDVILDYSHCGYMGGGVAIPDVPVAITLTPSGGDDGPAIQAAIDELAAKPLGADGFRGAILLKAGTFKVGQELYIRDSGIVLRGEGAEEDTGTLLLSTMRWKEPWKITGEKEDDWYERVKAEQSRDVAKRLGKNNTTLITVGAKEGMTLHEDRAKQVTSKRVAVGAYEMEVESGHDFKAGDTVIIERIGNKDWISTIRMDQIRGVVTSGKNRTRHQNWGEYKHRMDRVITAVNGNTITVDVPMPIHIDQRWGGATVTPYSWPTRVKNVGVEHMRLRAQFDKGNKEKDKDGKEYVVDNFACRSSIIVDNAESIWISNIASANFMAGKGIQSDAKFVTVQDCVILDLVSEIVPGSRGCYALGGSMMLFNRCYAETGRHTYSVGSRVEGPNAIVDCVASKEHSDTEPHHRYSVGGLFDNVDAFIKVQDRQSMGSGHGYQGANYVAWNTKGTLTVNSTETAENYSFGHIGGRGLGTFVYGAMKWREDNPNGEWPTWTRIQQGYWEHHGQHVSPRSLYLAQLEDRLGADAVRAIATPEQITGDPIDAVLAHAQKLGAAYTDAARERDADNRSWIRLRSKKEKYEDAELKGDGVLMKTDIPNHFE